MSLNGVSPNLSSLKVGQTQQQGPTPAMSSTQQRPHLLAFFAGGGGSSGSVTPGVTPLQGGASTSRGSSTRHFNAMRDESRRVALKSSFLAKATTAAFQQKVSTTIATFLPTGLLRQLSSAVLDASVNPRLPAQCPGVYLVISLAGLHAVPELPMESITRERRLRHVFDVIATRVHAHGGQLIRVTGESCLACWPLRPRNVAASGEELRAAAPASEDDAGPSGLGATQVNAFAAQQLRAAAHAAAVCAIGIVQELHGHVLWSSHEGLEPPGVEPSSSKLAGAANAPAAAAAGEEESAEAAEAGAEGVAAPGVVVAAAAPAAAAAPEAAAGGGALGGLLKGKWGGAKSLLNRASQPKGLLKGSTAAIARGDTDTRASSSSGLGFLDAVKAAKQAEEDGGVEHKLELGAALTLSAAQAMHVGGANGRWEYVVCAPELSEASRCVALCVALPHAQCHTLDGMPAIERRTRMLEAHDLCATT